MAGVNVGVGYIDIRPDMKGFGRELQTGVSRNVRSAGDDASRTLKGSFANAARGAAAAFGAAFAAIKITDFLGGAIQAASDLNEVTSKTEAVFGSSAEAIKGWAGSAADNIGLSRQAALDAASSYGSLFTQLGITGATAVTMSEKLVEAGVDLRSFAGGEIIDVLDAINASFRGEFDSLQRWVPLISAATVEQQAMAETGKKNAKALTQQEKAAATYSFILDHMGAAQGDFARTSESLANQQQALNARWTDAKATLGQELIPVMTTLIGFISKEVIPTFKALFLSEDADPTHWASKIRDAIGDVVGFFFAGLAGITRAVANVIDSLPTNFGEGMAEALRADADALDLARERLHASTGELLEWAGASRNAEAAAKLLVPSVKAVGAAMKGSVGPTEAETKAMKDAAAARRDLDSANRAVARSQRDLAEAQEDYKDAEAAFLALPTDTNADKLRDARNKQADAEDSVADAKGRQIDAQEKADEKEAETVRKTPAVVKAINDRTEAVRRLNEELGITNMGVLNDVGNILNQTTGKALPPPAGPAQTPIIPSGFAAMPGGFGPGVPNVAIPKVTTNNITVNVPAPVQDPGLIGKAIAWVL